MIILSILIAIIAGVAKAVKDKINFHYKDSIFSNYNPKYWDPLISWQNKWNYGYLVRTVFVWVTDAWHLFDTIHTIGLIGMVAIPCIILVWWKALIAIGLLWIIKGVIFELCFSKIFKK